MKKDLLLCLVLFLLFSFHSFAGGQKEETEAMDWKTGKMTVKVVVHPWILQKFPIGNATEKFMSDHPNITMELTGNPDYDLNTYMLNWAAGDIDVDLCFHGEAAAVGKLAFKGLLEPWNDFYQGEFSRDNFLAQAVEVPKLGNEYYAIPFMAEGMSLQANKSMMINAGLGSGDRVNYPESLDELYEFAKKLTKGSGEIKDVYGFGWTFTNFGELCLPTAINCLGGKAYNADKTPNLKDPKIVDIFAFIKKVTMDGYGSKSTLTDGDANRAGYKARKIAIIFEAASRAIEAKANIGDDAVLIPFPGMEKNGSFIFCHHTYIPKGTKVRDASWAFMREQVFSKEFSAFAAEKYGKLPSLKRNYEGLSADFSQIQKWLANPKTIGSVPWVEGAKLRNIILETEQALVTSDITPQDAAAKLAERASKLDLRVVK